MRETRDVFIDALGLRHHLVVRGDGPKLVVLIHGWLDCARLFDGLSARLATAGRTIAAIDLRGHGESEHAGAGCAYPTVDWVADVHQIVEALRPAVKDAPAEKIALIGHSLGGGVALRYAGAFPERVSHLVNIEGLGPPDEGVAGAPDRLRRYVKDLARYTGKAHRVMASVEEAARRVRDNNPTISEAAAVQYARYQTRPVLEEDGEPGGVTWRFDVRQYVTAPQPMSEAVTLAFASRIDARVLYVEGEKGFVLDDATRERRLGAAKGPVRVLRVAGAGHHVHLNEPEIVGGAIDGFLDE